MTTILQSSLGISAKDVISFIEYFSQILMRAIPFGKIFLILQVERTLRSSC
jgi:ribonucleotide reductase beta subunit family protein with ferritin-like domain